MALLPLLLIAVVVLHFLLLVSAASAAACVFAILPHLGLGRPPLAGQAEVAIEADRRRCLLRLPLCFTGLVS